MDKFLMICSVAADFGPYRGEFFRVRPQDIGLMLMAPVWIQDTLLFKWLVNDGSIKIANSKDEQKQLENDPLEGLAADGKKVGEEPEEKPEEAEEQPEEPEEKPKRRTRAKKGEKA